MVAQETKDRAIRILKERERSPSISALQLLMKIGFEEAEEVINELEADGVISAIDPKTGVRDLIAKVSNTSP